ncbi:TIGR00730 family Rossman fold protein [Polyangium sorediatum]|uniref:Cytokinin riboside 5'-monophosphate phosphoribohydrolase n=1 Tax=Polyangium sorediatum TaxID=889274 RepID=A0ABT6P5X8_9BACT|nr:TIGR00730 family Rossman fold protein [Polyangium sorediatum]MDI1436009.1 TIGR00730 family Rossman fold protein [Polyangium sorediatum]
MNSTRTYFRRVAVYCGSSGGVGTHYLDAARAAGSFLAERGIDLVYGGGRVGMMGAVAEGALMKGGRVYGVIPEKLKARELAHEGLTELFIVDSMHARKTMMASMADAFVALPGGWGTLEEVFEVVTWSQLNYHKKPVGLLNVRGYYDHLVAFLDHAMTEGFIRPIHRPLCASADTMDALLDRLSKLQIPDIGRWIDKP